MEQFSPPERILQDSVTPWLPYLGTAGSPGTAACMLQRPIYLVDVFTFASQLFHLNRTAYVESFLSTMEKTSTIEMAEDIGSVRPTAEEVISVTALKPSVVDSALTFLGDTDEVSFSLEEEKTLVRKIDWILMPPIAMVYFVQFIDKNLSKSFHNM